MGNNTSASTSLIVRPGDNSSAIHESLCQSCRNIPWSSLSKSRRNGTLLERRTSAQDLHDSNCRMCQLMTPFKIWVPSGAVLIRLEWSASSCEARHQLGEIEVSHNKRHGTKTMTVMRISKENIEEQEFQKRWQNVDFDLVKKWLIECRSKHQSCYSKERHDLHDLRVIDCTRREIVQALAHCDFVALSYVWGRETQDRFLSSSILSSNLPQTIEDSIVATLTLGFNYLWVDRYGRHSPYVPSHVLMTYLVYRPARRSRQAVSSPTDECNILFSTTHTHRLCWPRYIALVLSS
jgi:hypothetical protein